MFHHPDWAVGSYSSGPPAGWGTPPNLSQPNPGSPPDGSPCIIQTTDLDLDLDDELPTDRLLLTELPDRDRALSLPEPDDRERDLDLDLDDRLLLPERDRDRSRVSMTCVSASGSTWLSVTPASSVSWVSASGSTWVSVNPASWVSAEGPVRLPDKERDLPIGDDFSLI